MTPVFVSFNLSHNKLYWFPQCRSCPSWTHPSHLHHHWTLSIDHIICSMSIFIIHISCIRIKLMILICWFVPCLFIDCLDCSSLSKIITNTSYTRNTLLLSAFKALSLAFQYSSKIHLISKFKQHALDSKCSNYIHWLLLFKLHSVDSNVQTTFPRF